MSLARIASNARAASAYQQTRARPRRPASSSSPPPALGTERRRTGDLDTSLLLLQGQKLTGQLRRAVTDMQLDQTMDGAGTLTITVSDYYMRLLRSRLLDGATTLVFDNVSYTLVKTQRQDNNDILTFEETAVSLLRLYSSPKKANRANTTRAQFVRSMVREVTQASIPFRCPEVNVRQPIASPTASRARWAG